MRAFPVIKDLVSDVSWNYEVSKGIKPFQTSEQAPFTMYEEDVERLYEPKRCIECFMCQDVCHVLRTHHKDRKSTRLNSSHANISYAVFCLKKKKNNIIQILPTFLKHHSGP